jgi:phosphoribosylglycinamide formyltransferase 1
MEKSMNTTKPKLIIFASGSKDAGGSGFRKLLEQKQLDLLSAEIVAVVSNHENGGVRKIADEFGINFIHFAGPFEPEEYQKIVAKNGAEFVALSGWLKLVSGLPENKTFNIHPGPLPQFGGFKMYGHFVHEAVIEAFKRGEVTHSAVTMHFVTEPKGKEDYDKGPVIFRYPVKISADDTPEILAKKVNAMEHVWQPFVTNLVVNGHINWSGNPNDAVVFPPKEIYPFQL